MFHHKDLDSRILTTEADQGEYIWSSELDPVTGY